MKNCPKCGREISDDQEICDDCQREIDEAKAKEEEIEREKERLKAEKRAKAEEKRKEKEKAKQERERKKAKEPKGGLNNKYLIIGLTALVVIALILFIVLLKNNFSSHVGAEIGNVRNFGYSCTDGKHIYFLAPNADATEEIIYKANKDGTNIVELYNVGPDDNILSINVYDNYLYYVSTKDNPEDPEDDYYNVIYRLKTNGKSEPEILNENEFNNQCYEIYVINGRIYYIGEDSNIYKMNLDGSHRTLVSDNKTGYLGINEDYIVYNVIVNEETLECETHIMNLDGSNDQALIKGRRLYSISIKDDYVYYTNSDKKIYRTKIGSGLDELVCDTQAYNLNLSGDYIYFFTYMDSTASDFSVGLFRVKADVNQEPELVRQLEAYSQFLNVLGNYVMYVDTNDVESYINLVATDRDYEQLLYRHEYQEETVEAVEQEPMIVPEDPSAEVVEETPATPEPEATNTPSEAANTVDTNTTETTNTAN